MLVDLRSDTVTRPTAAMRAAMAQAEVGDDIYREDPTARRLEEEVAALLGKEAALFVPSGTMANQIAMQLHLRPGDEVIVGEHAHVVLYESGALAALAGAQHVVVGRGGLFDAHDLDAAIARDYYAPRTRLVALENTHNRAGGRVWPQAQVEAVCARAREHGLATHLDGARIWNAAIATGRSEQDLARPFDTVAACFSKGLGAPVGSAIAGSHDAMREALRIRKRMGGGMRQVGILAAAALHALAHHRARLDEDHAHARELASGLAAAGYRVEPVETNIVLFTPPTSATVCAPAELAERARQAQVLVSPFGPTQLRAVTHLDVDGARIARAVEVLGRLGAAGCVTPDV
jgi:threonine aldolase